ncbi:MAG: tRNA (guanine(10)-N(2))-dimethyltransferase [Candidatus Micrarchaeota archaeon]
MQAKEGKAEIRIDKGVFYNPEMEFCRDFSSLAFGAVGGKDFSILDGMCATGIRGIRYAIENENAGEVTFVDIGDRACKNTEHNAKKNNVDEFKVQNSEITEFLWGNSFDFIEIDPFGSPVPYLVPAIRSGAMIGGGHLSVTATDVAVLCGAHYKACLKNYQARPMDNECCHENGVRILLGKIARTASEYNLGVAPVASLSRQHFMKVFVRLERGAEKAVSSIKNTGFISYCPKCLWRESSSLVLKPKCRCGGELQHAGPLWLGELHEKRILEKMRKENGGRDYGNKERLDSTLEKMLSEVGMPAGYYDLHKVSEVMGISAEKVDKVVGHLAKMGFDAYRTHFRENSIKTKADIDEIKEAFLNLQKDK